MARISVRTVVVPLAALVLIAGALAWRGCFERPKPERRPPLPATTSKLYLLEGASWNGFRLRMSWNAIEGTERYLINVYDPKLRPLSSQEVIGKESCGFLLDQASQHRSVWVRVRALRDGAVLEDSGLLIVTNRD